MNVLFLSIDQYALLYCKLANELKNNPKDYPEFEKFYYLTFADDYKDYILANSPSPHSEVINLYKNFNIKKIKKYDIEEIKRFENLYGIPNLWLYVVTDRKFSNLPLQKIYDLLCWHLDFFENLYKNKKIDLVVSTFEGGFIGLSMKRVSDYYKIPNLYIGDSRFPNRIIFSNSLFMFPIKFEEAYNDLRNRKLNEEELNKAKQILSLYREKRIKPSLFKLYATVSKLSGLSKILTKIKKYYFGEIKNLYNFSDVIKFSTYARKIRFLYCNIFFSRLFKKPNYKDNYFYFPLNYQPEIMVDILAPYYKNQKIVIDFISKSMPAGYYLYVKDHPHVYGLRPISYYKEISKYPRVKLIKTEVNSYDLIEKSSGVITISATTGWEAILLKKPVIVFGQVFYKFAKDLVYFIEDVYKLPHILKKAAENYVPNEDNVLKFCYLYYSYTYPGIIGPPSDDPNILSDENIKNIADALVKEYKKLLESKLFHKESYG